MQNHERQRTNNLIGPGFKFKLRAGCRHGLSDEEKENASDNFELHLELVDSKNIAVVLILFLLRRSEFN